MQSSQHAQAGSPTATRALAEVRRLVLQAVGKDGAIVYLFGSWARGEATRLSDIDVAIDPPTPLPRGTLARLREQLEESSIPYYVDIVDLSLTDSEFRRRVLAEGVLWSGG